MHRGCAHEKRHSDRFSAQGLCARRTSFRQISCNQHHQPADHELSTTNRQPPSTINHQPSITTIINQQTVSLSKYLVSTPARGVTRYIYKYIYIYIYIYIHAQTLKLVKLIVVNFCFWGITRNASTRFRPSLDTR